MPPPLMRQIVSLPLYGGQREDVDERLIGPGQFTRLEEYVLDDKHGKLAKRIGYTPAIGSDTTFDTGYVLSGLERVASTGREIVAVDTFRRRLLARSEAEDRWLDRGEAPGAYVADRRVMLRDVPVSKDVDCAALGDWLVYAWVELPEPATPRIRITVVDRETGGRVLPDRTYAGISVRLVQLDGVVVITWLESLAVGYHAERITSAGFGAAVMLLMGPLPPAAAVHQTSRINGTLWNFCYSDGADVIVARVNEALVWLGHLSIAEGGFNVTAGSPGTTGRTLVVWQAGAVLRGAILDQTAIAWVGAPFDIDAALVGNTINVAIAPSGPDSFVVYDTQAPPAPVVLNAALVLAGGAVWPMPHTHSVGLASKAFVRTGVLHVLGQYYSPEGLQDSYFLLALHTGGVASRARIVATIAPREAANSWTYSATPSWAVVGSDEYMIALPIGAGRMLTASYAVGIDDFRVSFDPGQQWLSTQVRGSLLVGGGVPSIYDGHVLGEAAFQLFPDGVTAAPFGAAGALSAGSYQYRFVYERTLADGTIMRSAPSPAVTVTVVANNEVACTIPYLWLTNLQSFTDDALACRIVPYRTLVDGTTFYRVYDERAPLPPVLINNIVGTGLRSTTWSDGAADTDIDDHAMLYAQDGVLDHVCPPSATISCVHFGRVFLAEGQRVWYSQPLEEGVAASFNDDLTFNLNNDGGAITGLVSDGTSLVIFQRRRVFRLYGWGPNKLGMQSDYQEPQEVSRGIGCDEPRSVVRTPAGIVFGGQGSIYLLGGEGLRDIGAAVRDTLALHPTITSASALASQSCVMLTATSGADSLILYWHYPSGQWAVHRSWQATIYSSACEHGGYHVLAHEDDHQLHIQDPTRWKDGPYWVTGVVETSWIRVGALAGVQKVRRALLTGAVDGGAGERVLVEVGYDYLPAYAEAHNWDPADLPSPLQLDCWVHTQRCRAVRFRIRSMMPPPMPNGDPWPGSTDRVSWIGLDLEVAAKVGPHKQAPSNRK